MDISNRNFHVHYIDPYQLRFAALFTPTPRTVSDELAEKIQFRSGVDLHEVRTELWNYRTLLKSLGIQVYMASSHSKQIYNIHFASDSLFSWGGKVYLASMKNKSRKGEPVWLEQIMPFHTFRTEYWGVWESSDVLVTSRGILVGVGNRTSEKIIPHLEDLTGISCKPITIPKGIQHLMGIVRPLGHTTVAVRSDLLATSDWKELVKLYNHIIHVEETEEVTDKLGFNFVPIREETIIMPADTPALEETFRDFGVNVFTAEITELRKTGGGLACATGRLL